MAEDLRQRNSVVNRRRRTAVHIRSEDLTNAVIDCFSCLYADGEDCNVVDALFAIAEGLDKVAIPEARGPRKPRKPKQEAVVA